MNWDAIGAVGELAGAAAVVISLVYLARQVGTSNRLARAEAFRAGNTSLNALNAQFGTDPAFRRAMARILYDGATRSDLDLDERGVLDPYLVSVTNLYEQLHREVREGVLDEHVLEDFAVLWVFDLPYFKESWTDLYRNVMSPSFVESFARRFGYLEDQA